MPISRRLQVGDDAEAVVGGLCEVEEQPFAGAVDVSKRTLAIEPIVLGAVRKQTVGCALLPGPEASYPGILRVQEVDGCRDTVNRDSKGNQALRESG